MYPSERSKRQAFSTVFKSGNERKRERVGSICIESNYSSPAGKFYTHIRKKDVMTMLFHFHLPTQNWVYIFSRKKTMLSSLQCILTWTVLSYQTELKGTKTGHDRVVFLAISPRKNPAAPWTSFSDENYVMSHEFIFGIP